MVYGSEPLKLTMPGYGHGQDVVVAASQTRRQRPFSMASKLGEMTPPLTPALSDEEMAASPSRSQVSSTFPTYLRAVYPFHPPYDLDSDTITLPLNQGDIILIHSIHSNGWADGTLLDTAHRGWLPTNYCEEFDADPLRTLLNALTTFWDSASEGGEGMITMIHGHNLTQGLVAGVRCLLTDTDCLTRDQALLDKNYGHAALRRYRKALLSDLSEAVKFFKTCEPTLSGAYLSEDDLNQLVLKTFKVIVRAVKFFDVWVQQAEESQLTRTSSSSHEAPAPPTPPSETTSFNSIRSDVEMVEDDRDVAQEIASSGNDAEQLQSTLQKQPIIPVRDSSLRSSLQATNCLYHRISWSVKANAYLQNNRLASSRLNLTNETFLSCLGVFLGIHLNTQTPTEVLVATQQAVNAGRALLTVVEAVWDRGLCKSKSLEEARDKMYKKITKLVYAAQQIFASTDHEDAGPVTRKHLSHAALSCVRCATVCVDATRAALEIIGDFEFEIIEDKTLDMEAGAEATSESADYTIVQDFPLPPENTPRETPLPPSPTLSEDQTTPTHQSTRHVSIITAIESNTDVPPTRLSVLSILQPPPSLTDGSSAGDASPLSASSDYIQSFPPTTVNLDTKLEATQSPVEAQISLNETWSSTTLNRSESSVTLTDSTISLDPSCEDDLEEAVKRTTFSHELIFNKDGQVSGGTLPALVERLTTSDSRPDHTFLASFFLTFRLFTTPEEFAKTLVQRYHYIADHQTDAAVVRLRVYNIIKTWMESNWKQEADAPALPIIQSFAQDDLVSVYPSASTRLLELVAGSSETRSEQSPMTKASAEQSAKLVSPKDATVPVTLLSRSQSNLLKTWQQSTTKLNITDFDPLEIARQLTIKSSALFCSIQADELLATEWTKKKSSNATNVRAIAALSNDLTNLVAETILQHDDHTKRAKVIKHWIKVASKCLDLDNYDSLMAIVCSLQSTPVSRLKRTWESIGSKAKTAWELLTSVVSANKNFMNLRQRTTALVAPALPFLGMYLTDLTFVEAGISGTRNLPSSTSSTPIKAINFDKYAKTAKIISELQCLQVPYPLHEVPEFQAWLQIQLEEVRSATDSGASAVTKHYRRSCALEPRASSASRSAVTTRIPPLPRTQSDFLSTYFK